MPLNFTLLYAVLQMRVISLLYIFAYDSCGCFLHLRVIFTTIAGDCYTRGRFFGRLLHMQVLPHLRALNHLPNDHTLTSVLWKFQILILIFVNFVCIADFYFDKNYKFYPCLPLTLKFRACYIYTLIPKCFGQ